MKLLLLSLLLFAILTGCKKDDVPGTGNTNPTTVPKGVLMGRVVAANNTTPVRNALVFVSDSGAVSQTYTDVNGLFTLEAPAGARKVIIQAGSGTIFRTQLNVTVEANKVVMASAAPVKLAQVASLAYYPGNYDKIEAIVMDSLGYAATMLNPAMLHNLNDLSQFSAVFINCGNNITTDYLQDSVLASYVANGGSLYVSDYAVAALIGTYVGPYCPSMRPGGFLHDTLLCTQRTGNAGWTMNASITSPALQTYLSKNTMDVRYNLTAWELINNYSSAFWEVLVKDPVTQKPLLIRSSGFTNSTAGTVTIGGTTGYVTICHKPAGSSPITLTIPSSDLAFHLAHGDSKGSCQSTNGAGRIYYTTFHNEPNGQISPDMKHILDYVILNL